MFSDYSDVITVEELREILYIGKNQAYNLLNSNKIQAVKVGRVWRIPLQSVIDFLGYRPKQVKNRFTI